MSTLSKAEEKRKSEQEPEGWSKLTLNFLLLVSRHMHNHSLIIEMSIIFMYEFSGLL